MSGLGGNSAASFLNIGSSEGASFVIASHKTYTSIVFDKKIHIAVGAFLHAGARTEDPKPFCLVFPRDSVDFIPLRAYLVYHAHPYVASTSYHIPRPARSERHSMVAAGGRIMLQLPERRFRRRRTARTAVSAKDSATQETDSTTQGNGRGRREDGHSKGRAA